MIVFAFAFNPVWQCLAIVNLFGSFAAVATFAKRLQIPNEASTTFANWLDVIDGKFIKWELMIAHKAMKTVEFAKGVPFGGGVSAARLGRKCSPHSTIFFAKLFPVFRVSVFLLVAFSMSEFIPLALIFFALWSLLPGSIIFLAICYIFWVVSPLLIVSSSMLFAFFGSTPFSLPFSMVSLDLFSFRPFFDKVLVFFRLDIIQNTFFTLRMVSVTTCLFLIEVFQIFGLLAFGTFFQSFTEKFLSGYSFFFVDHYLASFTQYKRAFALKLGRTPIAPKILPEQRPNINNNSYSIIKQNQHDWHRYYTIKGAFL